MIAVRGFFDNYNSYGILGTEIAAGLIKAGKDVFCIPVVPVDYRGPNWERVKYPVLSGHWSSSDYKYEREIEILPPCVACRQSHNMASDRVHITTFESPRLNQEWIGFENSCRAVVLPCEANIIGFNASGVHVPILHAPYGYDQDTATYVPMDMSGPCVFGIGGRIHKVTDSRKGAERAIDLFKKAFPSEPDVRLIVKTLSCDPPLTQNYDRRILLERSFLEPRAMAKWYAKLTCYLSLSCSEGWGLMQFESQIAGRPVISTNYFGSKEFFIPELGYEVTGTYTKARVHPADFEPGVWMRPDEDSVIEAMRAVYRNREQAREKGLKAREYCLPMTWPVAIQKLIKGLERIGFEL